jgi:NAD(P)-dependent dehydrogenase (short-subunit alcohol dehydrogenase family)
MEFNNQIAVVTGGASGMGKACARALTERGVRVVVWDRDIGNLGEAAVACDVSSAAEVVHALEETIARQGVPRICVNCAGIAPSERMVGRDGAMSLEAFKNVIDINLVGTFNVMRVVADAMVRLEALGDSNERGVIINTASIAAYEGQIGQMAYSASKGGVISMTLPAARELAQHGIRVNAIAPGLIATPLLLKMPQAVQDGLSVTVPFPKRFGKPEEFASLVMHIVENCMINGEVIRLDGALRMQPK